MAENDVMVDCEIAFKDQVRSVAAGPHAREIDAIPKTQNPHSQGDEANQTNLILADDVRLVTGTSTAERDPHGQDHFTVKKSTIYIAAVLVLVVVVVFLGTFCGTGNCGGGGEQVADSPSDLMDGATQFPAAAPVPPTNDPTATAVATDEPTLTPTDLPTSLETRASGIANYISSIALTPLPLVYPVSVASGEELALAWLIETDPLRLNVNTEEGRFRLRQRYALASLWFQQTQTWADSTNWLDEDECTWYGIECTQDLVTRIALSNNQLSGSSIPDDLGLLSSLSVLTLGPNSMLRGTLPVALGRLTSLTQFSAVTNLIGALPDEIGQWTSLTLFTISSNFDVTGTLPASVGQWTNLSSIDLRQTKLSGALPNSISNWSQIRSVLFDATLFTGTVPPGICPYISSGETLQADCISEIVCSCCTSCF